MISKVFNLLWRMIITIFTLYTTGYIMIKELGVDSWNYKTLSVLMIPILILGLLFPLIDILKEVIMNGKVGENNEKENSKTKQ